MHFQNRSPLLSCLAVLSLAALATALVGCTSKAKLEWDKARSANTVPAYEQYIKQFPEAAFTQEARTRLDDLYNRRLLFPAARQNKSGYIDASGKFEIQPQFESALDFVETGALIRAQQKWGFIDKAGRVIVQPRLDQAEDFSEGLAAVEIEGKWGFIDKTGKISIPPRFQDAWPFTDDRALVQIDDRWGFIDRTGKTVIPAVYSGGYIADSVTLMLMGSNGKVSITYKDEENRSIAKEQLEWLTPQPFPGYGPRYAYRNKKRPNEYTFGPVDSVVDVFSGGLARLVKGEKWGYIDPNGNVVIAPRFELCGRFREGRAAVRDNGHVGFIDTKGNVVVKEDYTEAHQYFSEGIAGVKKNGLWGFVGPDGELRIPCQFTDAEPFAGGLAAVNVKGKWGFVDSTGKFAVPVRFDAAEKFSDGLAAVRAGKAWGYVDKTGSYVIRPQFEQVSAFKNGVGWVVRGGKRSMVDATGTPHWTSD
jgi:hypothetical protein